MGRRARGSARRRSTWGTVRLKASGKYQASYRHGGIPGVLPSTVYAAPMTFQTEGDARVWLEMERRLIESDQWSPPADREAARRRAEQPGPERPTVATYARQWLATADLRTTTRTRYEASLRIYICGEPLAFSLRSNKRTGKRARPKVWTNHPLGDVALADLDRAQVHAWWRSLPLVERRRSCDLAYQFLRTICLAAVDDGIIDDGGHVTDTEWRAAWLRACAEAGIEGFRFHDLRHVGLTYTALAGATIRELQVAAGHTTPIMALRYQEVAASHMDDVVKTLDAMITGQLGP